MRHDTSNLPNGWILIPLAQLTTHRSGNSKLIKGRLSSVPDEDLYPGFSASGQDVWLDTWDHEGEAIVVSAVGARCGKAFLSEGRWSAIANTHVVEPLSEALNPKFLWYRLNDERFWIRSGTAQPFVKVGKTLEREFALPPVSEQHRIVEAIESYLTRLDAAVTSLERVQQNLERYRASVLKAAVEGRLVPTEAEFAKKEGRSYESASELLKRILVERRKKWIEDTAEKARAKTEEKARKADKPWTIEDDAKTLEKERAKAAKKYKEPAAPDLSALGAQAGTSNLPDLPEGWCWCTLGQLVWLVKDGPHYSPEYVEEGIPFITGGNVRPEGVDFDSAKRISPKLHKELCQGIEPEMGDMLYTKGGTTGIARVNTYNRAFSVWVHVAVLKLAQPIDAFYVQNALNSPWCYSQSQLYTHGVGNQDLGLTRMVNITIPLPPLAEQRRVNEFVARTTSLLVDVANAVKTGRERSRALRQSILKWAFEGKLVPQDPEDEPASALLERIKAERESMQPRTKRRTNKRKDEPTKHDEQLDLLGGSNK